MPAERLHRTRSLALVVAVVLLGISWSFALFRIHTVAYPLLWALAMPPLAFYYFSGSVRLGSWKHTPAAALAIYAVVLWQVSHGFGALGAVSALAGIAAATGAMWLGSRLSPLRQPVTQRPAPGRTSGSRGRRRNARLRAQGTHR